MRSLKKSVSIFICLILFLNSLSIAYGYEDNPEISLYEYSDALTEIINSYDPIYGGFTSDENGVEEPIKLNRLIIKTNSNAPLEESMGAVAKIEGYNNIHVFQYSNSALTDEAYSFYKNQNYVEYVEYDTIFCISPYEETEDVPDSDDHLSWGNSATKTDIVNQMLISSNIDLNEVIVGVFDSGLDEDHKQIDSSRLCECENFTPGEGLEDIYGHGTAMTSIVLDNTLPNVKVKSYKIGSWNGGVYMSKVPLAIEHAMKNGVDVINMSFGYYGEDYKHVESAVNEAISHGITFVCAAGNNNKDANLFYPALFSDVITVAATDSSNEPWKKSNWGSCVDLSAPGVEIKNLYPFDETRIKSGTSQAVPFVVSAVAILKSIDPSLTPQEIKERIKSTTFVPDGWNSEKYGTGILDCEKMIADMITERPKIVLDSYHATLTTTDNSKIYYTTNGTNPIVGVSKLYTEPICTSNVSQIRAIAYKEGMLPSIVVLSKICRTVDVSMRYKGKEKLELGHAEKIGAVYVADENLITYEDGKIVANSVGETEVIAFIGNNRRIIYNVTVDFAWWQLPHKIFYKLFGILLWSF